MPRETGFKVQSKMCATCIYRPDSTLDLKALEDQVRDKYVGFRGFRACHHAKGNKVCCRGFWDAHKDEFAAGQIAQRLDCVQFVSEDRWKPRKGTEAPSLAQLDRAYFATSKE